MTQPVINRLPENNPLFPIIIPMTSINPYLLLLAITLGDTYCTYITKLLSSSDPDATHYSDIVPDIPSGSMYGIYSDILSCIFLGIHSDILYLAF